MEKFIVSRDDSIFEGWPDVVLCNSGRLICVFSECEGHCDRKNARITYVTSDNRGRCWSEKHYLTEKAVCSGLHGPFYNCARISKLSDGRIAIVCDLIKGENENVVEETEIHLWFSSDDGETWEGPVVTPAHGIVPEHLTELPCGRWLLAAHAKSPETHRLCQYLWYSDDKGRTWSDRVTIADDPRYNLCEAGLLIVDDDTVVCFLRENSMQGWDGFKAISHDRGETWEGVYHVPLPGCHRPTAGWLADGNAFVTYRFLQGGSGFFGSYQNIMGAMLTRESVLESDRNRQSARICPLSYDRNLHADCGYTGWVQFDDGEILVVNYLLDDAPKAWIEAIALRPDEMLIVN